MATLLVESITVSLEPALGVSFSFLIPCLLGIGLAVLMVRVGCRHGLSQCSEPSSPSVLGVGPDGPPAVVRLFSSPWTDYGK